MAGGKRGKEEGAALRDLGTVLHLSLGFLANSDSTASFGVISCGMVFVPDRV